MLEIINHKTIFLFYLHLLAFFTCKLTCVLQKPVFRDHSAHWNKAKAKPKHLVITTRNENFVDIYC